MTVEAFPSNTISGHAFSEDGVSWTFSDVEPYPLWGRYMPSEPFNFPVSGSVYGMMLFARSRYGNAVPRTDGTLDHFATMERPKLFFGDAADPTRPTHILNGVSGLGWDKRNTTDPCHACCQIGTGSRCSCCKTFPGIDWTYTLLRPLK